MVLFNGLHNGINIVLVWYFYLFKKISNLCSAYFKAPIHDYIKQTIRSFSNLKTSKDPFSVNFDGITHKNKLLFELFNNAINAATKQYFTSNGMISRNFKIPTRITSKISNVNKNFSHSRRSRLRNPMIKSSPNNPLLTKHQPPQAIYSQNKKELSSKSIGNINKTKEPLRPWR